MVICHIWDADYPWDIRVEKVCQSLQKKHQVHLVCRNAKRLPRHEVLDGTAIHRLPCFPAWLGPFHDIMGFPVFFNPMWLYLIWSTVKQSKVELIVVRDIPLALTAAVVARWFKIPLLLDLAENYPAMLEDRLLYTPTSAFGRIARNPWLAGVVEKTVLGMVDHIIVVVEESRDRLLRMGVDAARITIVSNTPPIDRWQGAETGTAQAADDGLHLVYLGNLDGSRGIDTAIRAVAVIKAQGRQARLSIIGTGPNIDQYRELVRSLGVSEQVAITGRLEFSKVEAIMGQANVGLIPHYGTGAWNTTIPNKLFDFMSMGKPVIVSSVRPTERIVQATQCGLVFKERDHEDLAAAMATFEDRGVREQYGRRGKAAFISRHNWTVDERVLFESVERVMAAGRQNH